MLDLNWDGCSDDCINHIIEEEGGENDLLFIGGLLMAIGISEITKENLYEVYLRGCYLTRLMVSPGDLHHEYTTVPCLLKWVGLKANVSEETRSVWSKRIFNSFTASLSYQYRITTKELKDAKQKQESTQEASESSDSSDAPDSSTSTGQQDSAVQPG